MNEKKHSTTRARLSARECAYIAAFVALVVAAQVALAAIPGVEIVTLLFVTYAFAFGAVRGTTAATAFSFLRMFVFGFDMKVLVLYVLYFNILTAIFGGLGRCVKKTLAALPWLTAVACVCTAGFTMLDNVLTVFWYSYSERAAKIYFTASLSFMIPQVICTAVSVALLFLPLSKAFLYVKKGLAKRN